MSALLHSRQQISHSAGNARGGATGVTAVVGVALAGSQRMIRRRINDDLHVEIKRILNSASSHR